MFLRSCGPRCAKVHLLPVFDLTQVCRQSPSRLPTTASVHTLQPLQSVVLASTTNTMLARLL